VLFLQLTATFALLPLDALALLEREHLLILHPQLPTLELEVVKNLNNGGGFLSRGEIGKGQTPEHAIVKVIVERVRKREVQLSHQLHQLLLLDSKRDVLDNDRGGNQFIISLRGNCGFGTHRTTLKRSGSEIRKRTGHTRLLIKPGLYG
jgi:hypothetical protein